MKYTEIFIMSTNFRYFLIDLCLSLKSSSTCSSQSFAIQKLAHDKGLDFSSTNICMSYHKFRRGNKEIEHRKDCVKCSYAQ